MAFEAYNLKNEAQPHFRRAIAALGLIVRLSKSSNLVLDPAIQAGSGAATTTTGVNAASVWLSTTLGPEYYNGTAWEKFALAGSTFDMAKTVTAADELLNVDLSMNHATATGIGVDVQAIQATTARTSGSMYGVRSKTTSLAGDSGGTYYDFYAEAPTDGGGTVTHVAYGAGASHDVLIDCSGSATGINDIKVPSNVADAWNWTNGTLTYSVLVTTTATPGWVHTFTHTAAGEAIGLTGSINSATANYSAKSVSAVQLTTARTAGQVNGVKSKTTSLAGDLNSVVYADFDAASPTDGGGTVLHVAYKVESGHDIALDLSACATTQALFSLPTNVADAYNLYDRTTSLSYLKAVTTTGSESLAAGQRLTTTDGVVSGTAKVVGGRLNVSTADSTAINQAASGYSSFDVTSIIPANTLKAGSRLKFRAVVRISVALNGGATVEGVKFRIGSTVLITVHASTAGTADTRCIIEGELVARGAPGAAVALAGVLTGAWSDTVAKITVGAPASGVPTFATNGALTADVQVSTSAAGDASGRMVLEDLYTEVI